ncbi:MAG: hypothetical protein K6E98_11725 [Lachnospiraceae bacterium]|nr:hypothetical protein [Lachnospiraceae bacterium]
MPIVIDNEMTNMPVFIRKYESSKAFADMIHGYREITGGYNYTIENLTDLPEDEKYKRISTVIITKKKALYTAYKMSEVCPVNLNAYLVSNNNYIVVLSIDANHIYGKRVMKSAFGTMDYEPIGTLGKKKVHIYLTTRYYQGILPKVGSDIARFKDERNKKRNNIINEASFEIDKNLEVAMLEYDKKDNNSLKACALITLAKIVCSLIGRPAILVKTRHEGGMLRWIPMIFNSDDNYSQQYNDIKELYEKAEVFDSCSAEILSSELRYNYMDYSSLSYEYLTENTYNEFIRRVDTKMTYFIDAYGDETAPISVRIEIKAESINIIYTYDTGYLGQTDINKVHEMFVVLISRVVKA